ncbi:hypothetical protein [Salinilacihabitans rarus]|uniref:hypothetical protein n=1 Tax=Salinilacihabitans rarus TaxID=2961596 RepID=UPI0020C9249B|nr:hypothetical protein [Salinilacihabitans rarus]
MRSAAVAGASAGAVGATSGLASASHLTNDSADYQDLTIYVYDGPNITTQDSEFYDGCIDAAHDFAQYLESWFAYVGNVDVYTAREHGWSSLQIDREVLSPDDVRNAASSYRRSPENMNIAIIRNTDTYLGQSWGSLYNYESDPSGDDIQTDEGIFAFANADHADIGFDIDTGSQTGYDYGYNIFIHELIHGQTFNTEIYDNSGYYDHRMGITVCSESYTSNTGMATPSVMATGYTSQAKSTDDDEYPDGEEDCEGRDWERWAYVNKPMPIMSKCTAQVVGDFHYGDGIGTAGDAVMKSSIPANENPWR